MAIPAQQKPSTKPDDPSTDNHNPGHGDPPPAPKVTQRSICPATHSPPGRELPGAVSFTLLPERATCWPALTGAELRLLPLLSTHLAFPEIAAQMFLSRNTVKSQAYSLYRKLGASTRSQAVTRSRELGLLEG